MKLLVAGLVSGFVLGAVVVGGTGAFAGRSVTPSSSPLCVQRTCTFPTTGGEDYWVNVPALDLSCSFDTVGIPDGLGPTMACSRRSSVTGCVDNRFGSLTAWVTRFTMFLGFQGHCVWANNALHYRILDFGGQTQEYARTP